MNPPEDEQTGFINSFPEEEHIVGKTCKSSEVNFNDLTFLKGKGQPETPKGAAIMFIGLPSKRLKLHRQKPY